MKDPIYNEQNDIKIVFSIERPVIPPMTSANKLTVKSRPRRTSSLGKIDLGDTVRGLGTMSETKESKYAAKHRIKFLSMNSKNDKDLLKKLWFSYREMSYRHTWLTPLILLIIVYSSYITSGNRTETNPLHQFVSISYQLGNTELYAKGIKDISFVFFHMIFFTFLREFLMDVIIKPLVIKFGLTSEHKIKRTMEQLYSVFYYGISGPFGLYIMYSSDLWLFRTEKAYITYPDLCNSFLFKLFYLGQTSFWAQQACILVLQLEKPRKDHNELISHHIITLLLIWCSYVFHFTKLGLLIFVTMDVSDFFIALSKTCNYFDSSLTYPVFFVFVTSWIYLRHIVNIRVLYSVLTQFRTEGNYILNFATQQYKCWIALPMVFTLILALQLLNLYWLFLILRILYRMLWRGEAKDDRSESESEESDELASPIEDENRANFKLE